MISRFFVLFCLTAAWGLAQSRPTVVVELFTSEGCSSCPPADALLMRLVHSPDVEVIPLSEHVDYWNDLGWKDPFSAAVFSARQQDYGRLFRLESVYTPQMVVNGDVQFNGSDRMRAEQEIHRAAQMPHATVELARRASEETVRMKIDNLPQGTRNADIFLAITDTLLQTDVPNGENAGRHLQHTGVVRSLTNVAHLDAKKAAGYSAEAKINLHPQWRTPNVRLVLFVQDRATRKIVGATTLHL